MWPLSIFWFMSFIWCLGILYWIYLRFFKGHLPPLTASEEYEEYILKRAILDEHGMQPNEKQRKYKFFGLISYIDDEPDKEEFDESDALRP